MQCALGWAPGLGPWAGPPAAPRRPHPHNLELAQAAAVLTSTHCAAALTPASVGHCACRRASSCRQPQIRQQAVPDTVSKHARSNICALLQLCRQLGFAPRPADVVEAAAAAQDSAAGLYQGAGRTRHQYQSMPAAASALCCSSAATWPPVAPCG